MVKTAGVAVTLIVLTVVLPVRVGMVVDCGCRWWCDGLLVMVMVRLVVVGETCEW